MALSRELWERWQNRQLAPGQARDVLFRNVVSGFGQYSLAAQVAAKYVGGVVYVRDFAGSSRASFTPIASERQREALKLVTEGLFRSDSFQFKPEFLTRLAADPFEDGVGERGAFTLGSRVLAVQTSVLDRLMGDTVAARLLDPVGPTRHPADRRHIERAGPAGGLQLGFPQQLGELAAAVGPPVAERRGLRIGP